MERWISIHSRGHSDYRLTGDLHAPLQWAEHVFILFFSPLSSVLLWPGAADTRVSNRAEHRRDEARGSLIMNGWHWWWEKERGGKYKSVTEKGELWLNELLWSILTSIKMYRIHIKTLAVLLWTEYNQPAAFYIMGSKVRLSRKICLNSSLQQRRLFEVLV